MARARSPTFRADSGDTTPFKVTPVILHGVVSLHAGHPTRGCIPRLTVHGSCKLPYISSFLRIVEIMLSVPLSMDRGAPPNDNGARQVTSRLEDFACPASQTGVIARRLDI